MKSKKTKNHLTNEQVSIGYNLCKRKINALWRKNMRVEALLYMSLAIEFFLKEAISQFEKIVEGATTSVEIAFNPRNVYSREDIENQPLGYLIKVLDAYTADKNLIKELWKFSKVRNECVHKLFGQKISSISKQLKGFDINFYQLLIELLELNANLSSHSEKYFEVLCDDCFDKEIKKIKL